MKTQALRFLMKASRYDEENLAPLCKPTEKRYGGLQWQYDIRDPDLNIVMLKVSSTFEEAELTLDDVYEPHMEQDVDLLPMKEGLWLWEGILVDGVWIGALRQVLGDILWAYLEDRIDLDEEQLIVRESRQEHLF